MGFAGNNFYHVFNRGINKQKIFFNKENYHYFLKKIEDHIATKCDLLAYCLMPNHFHLLLSTGDNTMELSSGLKIALSSYTRGINEQEGRTGSLFQQNTKRKLIRVNDNGAYLKRVFDYIHVNPVEAKLCDNPEDWDFSSFNEYVDIKALSRYICNTSVTKLFIEDFNLNLDYLTQLENTYQFRNYE